METTRFFLCICVFGVYNKGYVGVILVQSAIMFGTSGAPHIGDWVASGRKEGDRLNVIPMS